MRYTTSRRLPPAYFAPSQFGKDAILKDENVFSLKKKHSSFIYDEWYIKFSNVKNFLIFHLKKPHN